MGKVDKLTVLSKLETEPGQVVAGVVGTVQVLIPLSGIIDVGVLRTKLSKNLSKIDAEIKSLTARLNNPGFINKAPEAVIQGAKDTLVEAEKQAEILRSRLEAFAITCQPPFSQGIYRRN